MRSRNVCGGIGPQVTLRGIGPGGRPRVAMVTGTSSCPAAVTNVWWSRRESPPAKTPCPPNLAVGSVSGRVGVERRESDALGVDFPSCPERSSARCSTGRSTSSAGCRWLGERRRAHAAGRPRAVRHDDVRTAAPPDEETRRHAVEVCVAQSDSAVQDHHMVGSRSSEPLSNEPLRRHGVAVEHFCPRRPSLRVCGKYSVVRTGRTSLLGAEQPRVVLRDDRART